MSDPYFNNSACAMINSCENNEFSELNVVNIIKIVSFPCWCATANRAFKVKHIAYFRFDNFLLEQFPLCAFIYVRFSHSKDFLKHIRSHKKKKKRWNPNNLCTLYTHNLTMGILIFPLSFYVEIVCVWWVNATFESKPYSTWMTHFLGLKMCHLTQT